MSKPDWKQEIALCNKYLSMDERNFHCWDYRRFVVDKAKIPAAHELDFAMDCIQVNFSNYSAWHNRSKLLPQCYPLSTSEIGITEEKRCEEIELIQNAAFTDPEDSSAWFYHTWLLGKNDAAKTTTPLLIFCTKRHMLFATFSRPVARRNFTVSIGTDVRPEICFEPVGVKSTSPRAFASIWTTQDAELLSGEDSVSVSTVGGNLVLPSFDGSEKYVMSRAEFPRPVNVATKEALEKDLQNCRDLLDLEPDSKWTVLSMILVMRTLDLESYRSDVIKNTTRLETIDPQRREYYRDLRSKFVLENQVTTFAQGLLSLSSLSLTRVAYPERLCMVRELDLSNNFLRKTTFIPFLRICETLVLDDNEIEELYGLTNSHRLHKLSLKNNPIQENEDHLSLLKKNFPNILISL